MVENYSNQTLLTLFNYDTDFIVVHKDAFTQQELITLGTYLVDTFGQPIYNDNSTTAFNTQAAINKSIFKSYVAYPILNYWSSTSIFLNGAYQTFWIPSAPGSVAVYAPYTTGTTSPNLGTVSVVNTTISFVAFSNQQQTLYIDAPEIEPVCKDFGINNCNRNTNQIYNKYPACLWTSWQSAIFFVYSNGNSPVLINNITFSR